MAIGKGSIHARLNAIEDRLISDLDRRIAQLSDAEKRVYENWRTNCDEQYRNLETEPGKYFEAVINGETTLPHLREHVRFKLYGTPPVIPADTDNYGAQDIWHTYREHKQ
jgi:hypothetical protein